MDLKGRILQRPVYAGAGNCNICYNFSSVVAFNLWIIFPGIVVGICGFLCLEINPGFSDSVQYCLEV